MTLVATVALGSNTYAWFTMNKEVSVTNMQVTDSGAKSLPADNAKATTAG